MLIGSPPCTAFSLAPTDRAKYRKSRVVIPAGAVLRVSAVCVRPVAPLCSCVAKNAARGQRSPTGQGLLEVTVSRDVRKLPVSVGVPPEDATRLRRAILRASDA